MAKKEKTTLQTLKSFKRGRVALEATKYVLPLVPAAAITGVNWEEWFGKAGHSLPWGFTFLIISVVTATLGLLKKDEIIGKKISPLIYLAFLFAMLGLSFKFLANVMNQMGDIFLFTAAAIMGSFTADQVDKSYVDGNIALYSRLVEENDLDPKLKARKEKAAREKAEQEAKAQKERALPTE